MQAETLYRNILAVQPSPSAHYALAGSWIYVYNTFVDALCIIRIHQFILAVQPSPSAHYALAGSWIYVYNTFVDALCIVRIHQCILAVEPSPSAQYTYWFVNIYVLVREHTCIQHIRELLMYYTYTSMYSRHATLAECTCWSINMYNSFVNMSCMYQT